MRQLLSLGAKLGLATVCLLLAGCAAMGTAIEHKDLTTQTQMSESIFLNPVDDVQKTVYVDIRNTSAKPLNITQLVKSHIASRGYRIVRNPSKAHYLLQVNILKVGLISESAAQKALASGYGGVLAGVATGALVSGHPDSLLAGGLIGGLVSTVANHAVKDNTYTAITDIQVSERLAHGQRARHSVVSHSRQGTSTKEVTTTTGSSKWMRYHTRIVSTADQVNLKFAEARPELERQLAKSIAGIF